MENWVQINFGFSIIDQPFSWGFRLSFEIKWMFIKIGFHHFSVLFLLEQYRDSLVDSGKNICVLFNLLKSISQNLPSFLKPSKNSQNEKNLGNEICGHGQWALDLRFCLELCLWSFSSLCCPQKYHALIGISRY